MARHRSPGGHRRHRAVASPPAQPARLRAIKVGLAAIATGALLVAGNALVEADRFGPSEPSADAGRNAALAAPGQTLAPLPPPPGPDLAPRAEEKPRSAAVKPSTSSSGPSSDGSATLASCTTQVASSSGLAQALSSAKAGDKICASGASVGGGRLTISRGGTTGAPVQVLGTGSTAVKGITVEASNVVVSGFDVIGAKAPGIELIGSNITASNNTVKHPTGGDYDGLRFFGSNIKILNNTITDINPDGSGAHADCMQTFATGSSSPASQNVTISGNRCERIDNQCLIAEGPHSSAGDGSGNGVSSHITFVNNVCEVGASQALEIDDVQHVRVSGNTISGTPDKAFSFQNKSTNAVVTANKIAQGIGYQVGMDSSSKDGYSGPAVGGAP
jgi:hypothetical protein